MPCQYMLIWPLCAATGMATAQAADKFPAMLSELFAGVPYVRKLGYEALGNNVVVRAVFDDNGGADYSERFDEVVDRLIEFEEKVWDGILPEMDMRVQAAPSRYGWPGDLENMTVVLDR